MRATCMTDHDRTTLNGMSKRLVAAVAAERRRHAWSVRKAAEHGGISNTTWQAFENTGKVTDAVRRGVANAFGWDKDWPESPPAAPTAATGLESDGVDYRAVVTAAALIADQNNALLDTLNEKLDRLIDLALEWRAAQSLEPHPGEQVFDVAP